MKLAIVTTYPTSKAPLNKYIYHLVKHLRQKEGITELVLLTNKTKAEKNILFYENGCKVTVKACWSVNGYTNIFAITKAINETKPDAILHNLQFGSKKTAPTLGVLLPWICKLKRIPNIAILHHPLEEDLLGKVRFTKHKLMRKVYGFINSIVTRLILQADTVAVTMQKHAHTLQDKYNAPHVKWMPYGAFEIQEAPHYDIPLKPFKILALGKFGTLESAEDIIEAVAMIRQYSNLNVDVVIANTNTPKTSKHLEPVKETQSHIKGITFTSYTAEEDLPKLLTNNTLVVFPHISSMENLNLLHQAGSYGNAFVMPDLRDLKPLVKGEGYKGSFFEPNSVSSLAQAIVNVLTNNAYRIELQEANYMAATAYPMSTVANMFLHAFEVIKTKKRNIEVAKPQEVIL